MWEGIFNFVPSSKKNNEIGVPSIYLLTQFCSFFWRWDDIENIFWDLVDNLYYGVSSNWAYMSGCIIHRSTIQPSTFTFVMFHQRTERIN